MTCLQAVCSPGLDKGGTHGPSVHKNKGYPHSSGWVLRVRGSSAVISAGARSGVPWESHTWGGGLMQLWWR